MGLFSFMETSFFFTLGITFLLILLLVYHFKQRIANAESKQDTMFEIINNLVQEVSKTQQTISLICCDIFLNESIKLGNLHFI